MHLLTAEHTADNMFLVCTVLSNLYMATFAKTSRKKSRLPCTEFLFTERLVIVLHGFEHNTNHRVNIMRRSCIFHVFNSQFSSD